MLPAGWSFEGRRVLDFGCGAGRVLRHFLEEAERGEVDWLHELHRVLTDDGPLIATFMGERASEAIAGDPWDPDRVGMNELLHAHPWDSGGPLVLHSECGRSWRSWSSAPSRRTPAPTEWPLRTSARSAGG